MQDVLAPIELASFLENDNVSRTRRETRCRKVWRQRSTRKPNNSRPTPTAWSTPRPGWRDPHALLSLMEDIAERPDRVDVRLWRREASPHRIHRDVAGAKRTPGLDAPVPFVFVQPLNADPGINTKIFAVAASLFEIAMELLNISFDPVVRCPTSRHPPITEPCSTLEYGLGSTPKPDRDG